MTAPPPECDPERVETVARALWEACRGEGSGLAWEDKRVSDLYRSRYRLYAAAAIAADRSPAEEAVKRVEMVRAVREAAWREGYEACYRGEQKHNPYRAALASPAPAPQGEGRTPLIVDPPRPRNYKPYA